MKSETNEKMKFTKSENNGEMKPNKKKTQHETVYQLFYLLQGKIACGQSPFLHPHLCTTLS